MVTGRTRRSARAAGQAEAERARPATGTCGCDEAGGPATVRGREGAETAVRKNMVTGRTRRSARVAGQSRGKKSKAGNGCMRMRRGRRRTVRRQSAVEAVRKSMVTGRTRRSARAAGQAEAERARPATGTCGCDEAGGPATVRGREGAETAVRKNMVTGRTRRSARAAGQLEAERARPATGRMRMRRGRQRTVRQQAENDTAAGGERYDGR